MFGSSKYFDYNDLYARKQGEPKQVSMNNPSKFELQTHITGLREAESPQKAYEYFASMCNIYDNGGMLRAHFEELCFVKEKKFAELRDNPPQTPPEWKQNPIYA
jgi:hypothetical protein